MCEGMKCEFYDKEKWREDGFKTFNEFLEYFMEKSLFGTNLECPCCGFYVDPDGDCGNCNWKNVLLKMGMI